MRAAGVVVMIVADPVFLRRVFDPLDQLTTPMHRGGEIALRLRDVGCGIEPDEAATGGNGLAGTRERAPLIGGRISIGPGQSGGTEVRLVVPAAAVAAEVAA